MFPQIAFGFLGNRTIIPNVAIGSSRGTGWASQIIPNVAIGLSNGSAEVQGVALPNALLDKTFAYFTFDDTSSNLFNYDSTGNYRFYFQYYTALYSEGLVGNAITSTNPSGQNIIQTANGGSIESSEWNLSVGGFIGFTLWTKAFGVTNNIDGNSIWNLSLNTSQQLVLTVKDTYGNFSTISPSQSFWDYQYYPDKSDRLWHLIGVEINAITGTYKIRINESPIAVGVGVFNYPTYTEVFFRSLGNSQQILDRLHFYSVPLTEPEWAYLYDSGYGTTTYPFN